MRTDVAPVRDREEIPGPFQVGRVVSRVTTANDDAVSDDLKHVSGDVIYRIKHGKIKPSKSLADSVVGASPHLGR